MKRGWAWDNRGYGIAALALALPLAACSGGGTEQTTLADQAAVVASDTTAQANRQLEIYRQLQRIHNLPMAASVGQDILTRFPASAAAHQVQQTLPVIQRDAKAELEQRRLAALWLYQVGPMAGGQQSTASLSSMLPAAPSDVRLILRRHSQWGRSVFLYDSGHGFVCHGVCAIQARFDGKSHPLPAFLPTTGEPALFIKNDAAFLKLLEHSAKLHLQLDFRDRGSREVIFETGGFDAQRWKPVGKH